MAYVEWEMRGMEMVNCNCSCGCPCQFNQLPTHGHCRAYTFVQVSTGRFGDVVLDGLRWGMLAAWPRAIHHGHGTFQAIVDERADPRQQAALEAIAHGRETVPGTLVWQVFSTTITNLLPTLVRPIAMTVDVESRTGSLTVPGVLTATVSPIMNPVTGKPHRVRVVLPAGFEYTEAEFARGSATGIGFIPLDFHDTHAHVTPIHWSTHGVVR
jgi:hypothetical protein